MAAWDILGIHKAEWPHYSLGDLRFDYRCFAGIKPVCDELAAAEFGFKSDKVVWIGLSDSE